MQRWLIVLLVGAVAVLGALLLTQFERREVSVDVGYSGEAASNAYFAVQRLLETRAIDSRRVLEIGELGELPAQTTMLVPGDRTGLLRSTQREWLQWARSGGHLWVVARDCESPPCPADADPLLGELGIWIADGDPFSRPQVSTQKAQRKQVELGVSSAGDGRLELDWPTYTGLWLREPETVDVVWGDDYVDVLISQPLEAGRLTVVSDLSFIDNDTLMRADHAAAFVNHLAFAGQRGVVFFEASELPWLGRYLYERLPTLVFTLFALLVALLWRFWPRFGPVHEPWVTQHRSLREHLAAAGRYYWRRDRSAGNLKSLRARTLSRLRSSHGQISRALDQGNIEAAAKRAELPAELVQLAIDPNADFAASSRALQRLRRQLNLAT